MVGNIVLIIIIVASIFYAVYYVRKYRKRKLCSFKIENIEQREHMRANNRVDIMYVYHGKVFFKGVWQDATVEDKTRYDVGFVMSVFYSNNQWVIQDSVFTIIPVLATTYLAIGAIWTIGQKVTEFISDLVRSLMNLA